MRRSACSRRSARCESATPILSTGPASTWRAADLDGVSVPAKLRDRCRISASPCLGLSGGIGRGSFPRHRQADLAAEDCEARIVLESQDEGVVEKILYSRVAAAPGPIEPLEGPLRIVAQRVHFRDLIGTNPGILLDQGL